MSVAGVHARERESAGAGTAMGLAALCTSPVGRLFVAPMLR
jgi:hypothetical protein